MGVWLARVVGLDLSTGISSTEAFLGPPSTNSKRPAALVCDLPFKKGLNVL